MEVTHPLANRETTPPDAVTVAPGKSHPIVEGVVDVPDTVAEDLAAAWSGRYGAPASDLLGGEVAEPPFDPSEFTNAEIADRVADIDDPDALAALKQAERLGQNRVGATDAIADRLDRLEVTGYGR